MVPSVSLQIHWYCLILLLIVYFLLIVFVNELFRRCVILWHHSQEQFAFPANSLKHIVLSVRCYKIRLHNFHWQPVLKSDRQICNLIRYLHHNTVSISGLTFDSTTIWLFDLFHSSINTMRHMVLYDTLSWRTIIKLNTYFSRSTSNNYRSSVLHYD